MTKIKRQPAFVCLLGILLVFTGAFAEPTDYSTPAAPSYNVRPSDSQYFVDTKTMGNTAADLANNESNGLEFKAGDSGNQAGTGMGAAISAGSALAAAGVQQLLGGNFPEAGRLFGLSGLEFGQAAASGAAQAGNYNGRSILEQGVPNSGATTYDPNATAQNLLTPEARQALMSQGVDPQSFMSQLASGNIRTPAAALSALGQDPSQFPVSSSQDPLTAQTSATVQLGVNENAAPNDTAAAANGGVNTGGAMMTGGFFQSNSPTMESSASAPGPVATGRSVSSTHQANVQKKKGSTASLLAGLGLPAIDTDSNLVRQRLQAYGITVRKAQTIFRIAQLNYRSFSQWRSMSRGSNKASQVVTARR